jgi:hypothetical protein
MYPQNQKVMLPIQSGIQRPTADYNGRLPHFLKFNLLGQVRQSRSGIHERTISFRFLRVLRLEVSV